MIFCNLDFLSGTTAPGIQQTLLAPASVEDDDDDDAFRRIFIQQPQTAQASLFSHHSWDPLHRRCHPSSLPTSTSSLAVISLPKSLFDPLILSTLLVTSTCGFLLQRLSRIIIVYESANHAEIKGNSAIPLSIYRVSGWSCWVLIFLYVLKPFLNYR